jgi:hypothetical protein
MNSLNILSLAILSSLVRRKNRKTSAAMAFFTTGRRGLGSSAVDYKKNHKTIT